jgi:N utilization substance protein B
VTKAIAGDSTAKPSGDQAKPSGGKGAQRAQQRSQARETALQLIYSFEQNKYVDDGMLLPGDDTDALPPETLVLARAIFAGFAKERPAVDAAVDKRLENWTIHRLAVADRALLRLGAYEILYCADTPPKVAINECIELAKRYGSDAKTAKLVNGVLDKIAREHRPNEVGAKKA